MSKDRTITSQNCHTYHQHEIINQLLQRVEELERPKGLKRWIKNLNRKK